MYGQQVAEQMSVSQRALLKQREHLGEPLGTVRVGREHYGELVTKGYPPTPFCINQIAGAGLNPAKLAVLHTSEKQDDFGTLVLANEGL